MPPRDEPGKENEAASVRGRPEDLRDVVLRSVHHELCGHLTMISGHAQLLEASFQTMDPRAESVGAIMDAAELMYRVVGDLAHFIGGPPPVGPATVVESLAVANVIHRAVRSIPALQTRSIVDVPSDLVVKADPARLRQCLLLVLRNAETYAPDGSVTLTGRSHGQYAVVGIADEGPGLPPEEHRLALEPFHRSVTSVGRAGSGLGLHIAAVEMAAMGGRIELAAAPSGGLRVDLWLPLSRESDGPSGSAPAPCHEDTVRSGAGSGT